MIDALKVVETLPTTANVSYGLINDTASLPVIGARLANGDTDATLRRQLSGIVVCSNLSDGVRQVTVTGASSSVDVSSWNLATLVITPPRNYVGTMQVQVRSTSTELSYASSVTVVRDISVRVLHGTACETPVGLNPFVSYVADTAPSVSVQSGVVIIDQSAIEASSSIYVPS